MEDSAGDVLWGLADHEGTIRDLVDSAGTVQEHRQYNTFGQTTSPSTPTADFPFAFTGRPLDADTGLYDCRARWYDPAVGRFVSEDPSGFAGGDANLYRYAGNSPVIYVDPSGLSYKGVGAVNRGDQDSRGKDKHDDQDPGALFEALEKARELAQHVVGALQIGAGMIPGGGETLDWGILISRDSTPMDRLLAGGSLGLNVLTVGFALNYGSLKGSKQVGTMAEEAGEAGDTGLAAWFKRFWADESGSVPIPGGQPSKQTTQAAQSKGTKFFKDFAKRSPTNHTTRQIGDYTEFAVDVPGRNGSSFTRWVKVVGPDGRTVRLYHDTFDSTGKFIHRGIKVPKPERHIP